MIPMDPEISVINIPIALIRMRQAYVDGMILITVPMVTVGTVCLAFVGTVIPEWMVIFAQLQKVNQTGIQRTFFQKKQSLKQRAKPAPETVSEENGLR